MATIDYSSPKAYCRTEYGLEWDILSLGDKELYKQLYDSASTSIGALVSKCLPEMVQELCASSPYIHHDLPEAAECRVQPFALLGQNVHGLIKERKKSSSFLSFVNGKTVIQYNSESLVGTLMMNYITDLLTGMGLGDIKLFQGIEVLTLQPDIWLLSLNCIPFLIIEVKKPGSQILMNGKVIGHIAQHMRMLRHYHNIRHVFGILVTMEEFRILWLPGCQPAAECPDCYSADVSDDGDHDGALHGTEVLSGGNATTHHYVASVIVKAYQGLQVAASRRLQLSRRVIFRVDAQHLVWARLMPETECLNVKPFRACSTFFLVEDLFHGAQGRTWLAITATSYTVVVLKLGRLVNHTRMSGAAVSFENECKMWRKMGFDAKTVTLRGSPTLVIPFAIGCKRSENGTYAWDTAAWDVMKSMFSEKDRTLVESAINAATPCQVLAQAIDDLINKGVWHQDIEFRHLGLFPTVQRGLLGLWSHDLRIRHSFFDYGKAVPISKANRVAAVAKMRADEQRLLATATAAARPALL